MDPRDKLIKCHVFFANQTEENSSVRALLQESLESVVTVVDDFQVMVGSKFGDYLFNSFVIHQAF